MLKQIDIKKSIHDLVKEYPDFKEVMVELGFKDIVLPGMLETAGRMMTLEKGAKLKKIDLQDIIRVLEKKGYEIV